MKYRTKDMANIMGVTPGALHYFEREDIIKTKKDGNGYRFYELDDIFRMLSYFKYHSMGISVKEISQHFSGKEQDRNKIIERINQSKKNHLAKISKYQQLVEFIDDHIEGCEKIKRLVGSYEFVQSPDAFFIHFGKDGWITPEKETQLQIQQWVRAMPATRISIFNTNWDQPEKSTLSSFGFTIKKETQAKLNLPFEKAKIIELPPVPCLHTVAVAGNDFIDNPNHVFEETLQYIYKRNLIPAGIPWGTVLLVDVYESTIHPVVELWFPIR